MGDTPQVGIPSLSLEFLPARVNSGAGNTLKTTNLTQLRWSVSLFLWLRCGNNLNLSRRGEILFRGDAAAWLGWVCLQFL